MRLCKKCGEMMSYDTYKRVWVCNCCGFFVSAVTIHGDRGDEYNTEAISERVFA